MVTCGNELLTHGHDFLSHGNEIKNAKKTVLCPFIDSVKLSNFYIIYRISRYTLTNVYDCDMQ